MAEWVGMQLWQNGLLVFFFDMHKITGLQGSCLSSHHMIIGFL